MAASFECVVNKFQETANISWSSLLEQGGEQTKLFFRYLFQGHDKALAFVQEWAAKEQNDVTETWQ
jgi:hypothetical protein